MSKALHNYIFNTEDVFENETYETENHEIKKGLEYVLNELSDISGAEWKEIFKLMNANSAGGKINNKEAYVVAASKIINQSAFECRCQFAQYQKKIWFYNYYWSEIPTNLLVEFLKIAAKKIGIPEHIASSVTFVNKLMKQFIQDAYFEKIVTKEVNCLNLKNGTLSISKNGIRLEKHHPRYFLKYILDFEYDENVQNDNFSDLLKATLSSVEVQKTLQQSISQILVKNFCNDKKVCLHGLNKDIVSDFINGLKEVIPQDLITNHFQSEDAKIEDLFIDYENVSKDSKSLENIIFIPCRNVVNDRDIFKKIFYCKTTVLNWLIDGAKEIIKNQKIYIGKESLEFKSRFNLVSRFISESNLVKTPKDSKSIISTFEDVHRQYEFFCELHDEEALTKTMFNRELKELGFVATRRESGNVWFAKFA